MDDLKVQNNVESFLGDVVQNWVYMAANTSTELFDYNPQLLLQLIADGKAWNPAPKTGPIDYQQEMEKILFAIVTPYAWRLSTEHLLPVIL